MTMDEFVESRFPGWIVEHVEKDIRTGDTVLIVKKDPNYMPLVIDTEYAPDFFHEPKPVRVSKLVNEYSPEVDWETLTAEFPDLAEQLGKAVTRVEIELDEDVLERMVEEEPDILAKLQRHLKTKKPVLKMTAREVQANEE